MGLVWEVERIEKETQYIWAAQVVAHFSGNAKQQQHRTVHVARL